MGDDQYGTNRMSSWDTRNPSTTFDPSRSLQNISAISMSPATNYVVPFSRYNPQFHPHPSIDERQLQQYQQPKYQSPSSETFQPMQTNTTKTDESGWCVQHITLTHVIGLLSGLIVTGVPLAVIVTLYLQLSTSSSNTTSSVSSSTNPASINLPSQCSTYTQLSDYFRATSYSYTGCVSTSCDSPFNNWYRVTGAAGTLLATSPVTIGGCGSYYPAWFNGTLPTTVGSTTSGKGCVNNNGDLCFSGYSSSVVLATNCGGFYVFYLTSLGCTCCSGCYYYPRYCTV